MVNKVKPEKLQFIYAYMKRRYLLVTVELVLECRGLESYGSFFKE